MSGSAATGAAGAVHVCYANADQTLIHRFLAGGARALPMDSNPLARALSCEIHAVDAARGAVTVEFEPDALFVQGTDVVQGGALSAMLDFAMAFAVLAHVPVGVSCATVTMNTSFQRRAPLGRYRAEGEVERCGRTMAFARARLIELCDGHLVASATSCLALSSAA